MMHMIIHAGLMEDGVLEPITMLACYLAGGLSDSSDLRSSVQAGLTMPNEQVVLKRQVAMKL